MDKRLVDYLATLGAQPDALDGWAIHTAQRDGVDAGFFITRGTELHILPVAGNRALSRKNIRQAIAPILDRYQICTTRVPISETDHRLRHALGFVQTWADAIVSYWALTELPYTRTIGESSCQ